jgi:hypothetical protein
VAGQSGPHGFQLLLVNTPPNGAVVCCRRLQKTLESTLTTPGPVRTYFGLTGLADSGPGLAALLRRAEEHLDAARNGGDDRLVAG